MTAPVRAKPGTALRLGVAHGYLVVTKATEGIGLDSRILAMCEPGMDAEVRVWCDMANAYPKMVEALQQYTGVVESVNDPSSFATTVRDAGHLARDLLRSLGELESE